MDEAGGKLLARSIELKRELARVKRALNQARPSYPALGDPVRLQAPPPGLPPDLWQAVLRYQQVCREIERLKKESTGPARDILDMRPGC